MTPQSMRPRDWIPWVVLLLVAGLCALAHVHHTCVAGLFGARCVRDCPDDSAR